MSTCNRMDLQTLGSQPVVPKNLPNHCPEISPNLTNNLLMKLETAGELPIILEDYIEYTPT